MVSALVAHGVVVAALTFAWLAGYALVIARAGRVLRAARVRRAIEAVSGAVLIGLGVKLAADAR